MLETVHQGTVHTALGRSHWNPVLYVYTPLDPEPNVSSDVSMGRGLVLNSEAPETSDLRERRVALNY